LLWPPYKGGFHLQLPCIYYVVISGCESKEETDLHGA
jgi:hypothetical protein